MEIEIRKAKLSDLEKYADLLQRTYQITYTDDKIGLKKEYFDKKYWQTQQAVEYLKSHLLNSQTKASWLAFDKNKLIGSVSCSIIDNKNAWLSGFYVDTKYQCKGIGKKLYKLVLDFVNNRDLQLEIYAHNIKTIEMYKRWGWKLDESTGNNGYYDLHWENWPKGLSAKCMYMKLKQMK